MDKFSDIELNIIDNRLVLRDGTKFGNIILKEPVDLGINLPEITEDDSDVVIKDIDHGILNTLGNIRADTLINEQYYFFIEDNKLIMRAGSEDENNVGDEIGICIKSIPDLMTKFTMNIDKCFKSIVTNVNIYIIKDKVMVVECNTDTYNLKYYLAPRVDE